MNAFDKIKKWMFGDETTARKRAERHQPKVSIGLATAESGDRQDDIDGLDVGGVIWPVEQGTHGGVSFLSSACFYSFYDKANGKIWMLDNESGKVHPGSLPLIPGETVFPIPDVGGRGLVIRTALFGNAGIKRNIFIPTSSSRIEAHHVEPNPPINSTPVYDEDGRNGGLHYALRVRRMVVQFCVNISDKATGTLGAVMERFAPMLNFTRNGDGTAAHGLATFRASEAALSHEAGGPLTPADDGQHILGIMSDGRQIHSGATDRAFALYGNATAGILHSPKEFNAREKWESGSRDAFVGRVEEREDVAASHITACGKVAKGMKKWQEWKPKAAPPESPPPTTPPTPPTPPPPVTGPPDKPIPPPNVGYGHAVPPEGGDPGGGSSPVPNPDGIGGGAGGQSFPEPFPGVIGRPITGPKTANEGAGGQSLPPPAAARPSPFVNPTPIDPGPGIAEGAGGQSRPQNFSVSTVLPLIPTPRVTSQPTNTGPAEEEQPSLRGIARPDFDPPTGTGFDEAYSHGVGTQDEIWKRATGMTQREFFDLRRVSHDVAQGVAAMALPAGISSSPVLMKAYLQSTFVQDSKGQWYGRRGNAIGFQTLMPGGLEGHMAYKARHGALLTETKQLTRLLLNYKNAAGFEVKTYLALGARLSTGDEVISGAEFYLDYTDDSDEPHLGIRFRDENGVITTAPKLKINGVSLPVATNILTAAAVLADKAVVVGAAADRTTVKSDFTMTHDGTNIVGLASGSTISFDSNNMAGIGTISRSGNILQKQQVRAYASGSTSVSAANWTQIAFASETFDVDSVFASDTFTAGVACKLRVTAQVSTDIQFASTYLPDPDNNAISIAIYKNGSLLSEGHAVQVLIDGTVYVAGYISDELTLAATDTVKIYFYSVAGCNAAGKGSGVDYVTFERVD